MSTKRRGKIIAFEGGEGAGKSTQIRLLVNWVSETYGVKVLTHREPGGTRIANGIRSLLLELGEPDDLDVRTQTLAFSTARSSSTSLVVAPAIESGAWVFQDRSVFSNIVYQGIVQGMIREDPRFLDNLLWPLLPYIPDLVIVISISDDEMWRRLELRPGELDRMEQKGPEFHRCVNQSMRELPETHGDLARIEVIDGIGTIDEVQERIRKLMRPIAEQWLNERSQ